MSDFYTCKSCGAALPLPDSDGNSACVSCGRINRTLNRKLFGNLERRVKVLEEADHSNRTPPNPITPIELDFFPSITARSIARHPRYIIIGLVGLIVLVVLAIFGAFLSRTDQKEDSKIRPIDLYSFEDTREGPEHVLSVRDAVTIPPLPGEDTSQILLIADDEERTNRLVMYTVGDGALTRSWFGPPVAGNELSAVARNKDTLITRVGADLIALNATTGEIKWATSIESQSSRCRPPTVSCLTIVQDKYIAYYQGDWAVTTVDIESGEVVFSEQPRSENSQTSIVPGALIRMTGIEEAVVVEPISPITGEPIWSTKVSCPDLVTTLWQKPLQRAARSSANPDKYLIEFNYDCKMTVQINSDTAEPVEGDADIFQFEITQFESWLYSSLGSNLIEANIDTGVFRKFTNPHPDSFDATEAVSPNNEPGPDYLMGLSIHSESRDTVFGFDVTSGKEIWKTDPKLTDLKFLDGYLLSHHFHEKDIYNVVAPTKAGTFISFDNITGKAIITILDPGTGNPIKLDPQMYEAHPGYDDNEVNVLATLGDYVIVLTEGSMTALPIKDGIEALRIGT